MTSKENTIVDKQDNVKQQESTPVATTPEQEVQEQNWKKFREKREEERKARENAERVAAEERAKAEAMKQAMEALLSKQPNHYQESEPPEESEDERINKKVEAALEARYRKDEQIRLQREKESLPQKLNQTFSDFDKVCSTQNLDYLEYHYPEVTTGYKNMPDSLEKWQNIYKAVKRFVPNTDHEKENKKMESNLKKPQGMSTSTLEGTTGTKAPNFLSEERRAENWARMQRTINKLD